MPNIAWAISEHIHNKIGARTLFATHYHQLADLAEIYPGIVNCHVQVREWGDQVIFLRKIVEGGTDKSYGIHVAQLAGLPRQVINRAGEVLDDLEASRVQADGHAKKAGSKSKHQLEQLALFGQTSPLLDEIEAIDISSITPLQAINKLYELQQKTQG